MSESKHTPGPWRVGSVCPDMVTSDDGGICSCANLQNGEANAILIAAAPDLLAVCEAIEWQYDPESDTSFCPCCKMSKERGHRGDCELSAAIRKAGGAK